IQYEIIYVGLHGMPTSAGSYQVRVRATDPNYGEHDRTAVYTIQRKRITIENITVEDKREDGTPDIFATGTLRGVLQNDNLILRLEARTANGATAPGRYNVTITKWEIVGVSASNYDIVAPIFTGVVSIRFNQLFASGGGAFIESNEGLSANAVFKVVNNISAPENKTNLFTAMFGQRAEVFHVSVEENGHHVILTEKIKFSVPIPESYRNSKNLKAVGIGALSEGVTFEIQGNYVVFWSDRPGEFMIVANDFPYWAVAVGAILFSILLGFALIKLFVPARRKKKLSGKVRRQIDAEDNQKEVQMGIVNRQQRVITDKWRKDELID
ncbi:MAG: hypothetical protein FWD49_08020, partial [Firmicutes bacterium]|nr:hypothetical protein [Bacillota bacterium]